LIALAEVSLSEIRFCLVGAGRAGLIHARNVARRIDGARVTVVCDASEANLAAAGDELGVSVRLKDYREAIARGDVDAVIIVTPTFLHREVACFAADNGKHVFLEKPMALSVAECEAINASVARANVRLQIGFMRRFDEGFLEAKAALDTGEMGRVMIIKSTGRGPGGPGPWMYDLAKSNGVVAEVNSHDIDSLLWFTGLPITRVHALAHNFKCDDAKRSHPDFYDNVIANFAFAGGTMGTIDGTCPAHYGYDARVEILCENGLLLVGHTEKQTTTRVTRDGKVLGEAVRSWRDLFKDAYLGEMQHFVDCVRGGATPRVTGNDGLEAVRAVAAINESIRTGNAVALTR
jgi:predicted dehydrogenase